MNQSILTAQIIIDSIVNEDLRTEAFTHRSYLNESKKPVQSNERLEFLGDAVLEIVISEYLFKHYPVSPEGDLTLFRSSVVRTESLAKASEALGLGTLLRLSKGEIANGGRTNQSILANTYEAVLGSIYLDRGLEAAREFVTATIVPEVEDIVTKKSYRDAKSYLQELVQEQKRVTPTYKVIKAIGPDHQKTFTVGVFINNTQAGEGTGKSKQAAENNAAQEALKQLSVEAKREV